MSEKLQEGKNNVEEASYGAKASVQSGEQDQVRMPLTRRAGVNDAMGGEGVKVVSRLTTMI